jgi:glycosyltransferase involved in cell wall biosynthesis
MKISIVTVAFDEEKNIRRTIESVLNQTSCDFEYIICDGKSADKTVEIAKEYENAFQEKGISYIVNSEKDKGIYDGMNKGIDLATGDYVFFLNAGDWFYSDDVIGNVVSGAILHKVPDVVYGNAAGVERGVINFINGDDTRLKENMSICHQALFASAAVMKEKKFDLKYRIAADYNFALNLKMEGLSFVKLDITVAYFSSDGVSTTNIDGCFNEQADIRESYGIPVDRKILKRSITKNKRAQKIKSLIPHKIWILWSSKIKKKQIVCIKNKLS